VKVRDAKAQAASTAAENMARRICPPPRRPTRSELMIKAGDSPREAAEKVGLTPQTGTLRMPLVEMPEEIRAAFIGTDCRRAWRQKSRNSTTATMRSGWRSGARAEGRGVGGVCVQPGAGEFFREMPQLHEWAKLRGKPPFIASFHRARSTDAAFRGSQRLPADQAQRQGSEVVHERSNEATYYYNRPGIVLSEEDLDTAVAIGVAYHSKGEHGWSGCTTANG